MSGQEVEIDFLLQVSSQYIGIKKPNKTLEILDKALDAFYQEKINNSPYTEVANFLIF